MVVFKIYIVIFVQKFRKFEPQIRLKLQDSAKFNL